MKIDGSIMIPVNCILENNLPTTIVGNQWYITVKNANDTVGKLWVPNSNGIPVCLGDTPITDSKIASLENQINVLNCNKLFNNVDLVDCIKFFTDKGVKFGSFSCRSLTNGLPNNNEQNYGYGIKFYNIETTIYSIEATRGVTGEIYRRIVNIDTRLYYGEWDMIITESNLQKIEQRISDLENALGGIN